MNTSIKKLDDGRQTESMTSLFLSQSYQDAWDDYARSLKKEGFARWDYGVLLSTVISMLIVGMPWLFYNMFTVFFDKNLGKPYLRQIFYYVIISFVACSISYRICLLLPVNEWMAIFVRLIICMIIPNGIFLLVYHKKIEFGQSVQMLDKITKGKFHLGSLLKS